MIVSRTQAPVFGGRGSESIARALYGQTKESEMVGQDLVFDKEMSLVLKPVLKICAVYGGGGGRCCALEHSAFVEYSRYSANIWSRIPEFLFLRGRLGAHD